MPNGGKTYFLGNGDCYSHVDYDDHVNNAGVDSVMVARGALIKPWVFEEIQTGQYLDKSATERLAYIERFAKYGLQAWGSDEHGVGTTRRFLLEWLSFAYRYVPIGLLEYLPPNIQDRPPAWRGRNELETLMGSGNYKDWIKITYVILKTTQLPIVGLLANSYRSEMFLGPAHKDFKFEPKHKSNSYEAEG
jgi:tRNA-dihydrouridine synthase 3